MARDVRAFMPIRSFDGMTRLARTLGPTARRRLMQGLAERTTLAAGAAGLDVTIVTNDGRVRRWADDLGVARLAEPVPGSLDAAAATAVASTGGSPWVVVHADLPSVVRDDIRVAATFAASGTVLAPSHDGGTSLVGGSGDSFPFRYGPGSFRRHLAAVLGRAVVLVRPGLALDLDRPRDLEMLRELGLIDDPSESGTRDAR